MTANQNRVEHAVTETLNERQLTSPRNAVLDQLQQLRRDDPRHWNENLRAYEAMTRNYAGLPQVQILQDGSFLLGPMQTENRPHPSLAAERQHQQHERQRSHHAQPRPRAGRAGEHSDALPIPPVPPSVVPEPLRPASAARLAVTPTAPEVVFPSQPAPIPDAIRRQARPIVTPIDPQRWNARD